MLSSLGRGLICEGSGGYVSMWAFPGGRDVRKLLVAAACVLTFQSPGAQPGTMPRFLPGLLHVGRVLTAAPDSAQSEQRNALPCYDPAQIDQAYSLGAGQDGAGVTIAIIDTYGSPTISSDLATF